MYSLVKTIKEKAGTSIRLSIVTFLLFFISGAMISSAQSTDVAVTMSPENPGPAVAVVLSLKSSTVDLTRSTITWYRNNTKTLSGIGQDIAQITSPAVGERTVIDIVIDTTEGTRITRQVVIEPTELDILWEAHTYTPPFYKGKALAASGGIVSLVAMPNIIDSNGNTVPPETLVYTWEQSGIILGDASGYAKQKIVLETHTSRSVPLRLQVTAATRDGRYSSHGSISVPVSKPEVLFYEKTPLEGVLYNRTFGKSNTVLKSSIIVHAEPFYFSLDDVYGGNMSYNWYIQNKKIDTSTNADKLSLELDSQGAKGLINVRFEALNNNLPMRAFQEVFSTILFLFK